MSILAKLLGRQFGDDEKKGIALFDAGRFEEAIPFLKNITTGEPADSGSLADFYLRQSLVRHGRSLLADGQASVAIVFLQEAAERWSAFPDLHFWHGVALAHMGRWADALDTARTALHRNGDYIEARLLEACALAEMDDATNAAASLNALLASGRRVEHGLIRFLTARGPFSEDSIPDNLFDLLLESAEQDSNREEIFNAVNECRAGNWEEGLASLYRLRDASPTYPDLRIKLAAALFQIGRNAEAMQEVDQAIVLNPRYRTALHLKTLILADQHRFAEARAVISAQSDLTDPVVGHPGEELFCAYLSAVLSCLVGHYPGAVEQLNRWENQHRTFPMATLLSAAVNSLSGNDRKALGLLEMLVDRWPHETTYRFQLACYYLELGYLEDLGRLLGDWPQSERDSQPIDNERLALMTAMLRLETGHSPDFKHLPKSLAETPAGQMLRSRALALEGNYLESYLAARRLTEDAACSEKLVRLLMSSYLALDADEDMDIPDTIPDSLLTMRLSLLHRYERTSQSLALLKQYQQLHPENLRWIWLDPNFWLEPVRRWIG